MFNTFGRFLKVTTWGESHGPAIGCVLDGLPSNMPVDLAAVQKELDRRKPGQSAVTTTRNESDTVELLSGVFNGKTTGHPISMLIKNKDADSSKYEALKDVPRPGHADYTYKMKYGVVDYRGGGRSSARETAAKVAAGAIAKQLLSRYQIKVTAFSREIGGVRTEGQFDPAIHGVEELIESNPVRSFDADAARKMEDAINEARKNGDSVGGIVEVWATGVPAGLGEPVYAKISADLAWALMSIPAAKGVEIGAGFASAFMKGGEMNDAIIKDKSGKITTKPNNAGGILGGITDGMPIILRAAFKPTASIHKKQKTINLKTGKETELTVEGRHDPCVVPRAVPVVEAAVALVLADHALISGFIPRKLPE
ncbi:Chorismate synthase [uncultured archaeon]|nr:Chorismate synthase [uncultured archaeon]